MHQREFMDKVKRGDTVYLNTRSKKHCGETAFVLMKDHRRAKLQFEDGSIQSFTFYAIEKSSVEIEKKDIAVSAIVRTNLAVCPVCAEVLFDYRNKVLDIEQVVGRCKHCGQKVKWDLRAARKLAEK